MLYDRFLSEIKGPNSISIEFYEILMPVFAQLSLMRNHEVNFNELIEELINFVMEERTAMVGLEYYCDYIAEQHSDTIDPVDLRDVQLYIAAVDYLGKAIHTAFKRYRMYVNGIANYRFKSWVTPTALIFEKYMACDFQPDQPLGTGLIRLADTKPKVIYCTGIKYSF